MDLKIKEWDKSYINKDNFVFYPHEEIIRFAAKYIAKRSGLDRVEYKDQSKSKVLDLGCGIGRHVLFFEKLGIDTYGIDLSKEAINEAKNWLEKENINIENKLISGSAEKLPWDKDTFGFIVSHGVLDSMPFDLARNIVKECNRVIKENGFFYCDLIGDEDKYGENFSEEVLVKEKHENGTIQSYFTIDKIKKLFENLFEIKEMKKIVHNDLFNNHYHSRYHLVLKKI